MRLLTLTSLGLLLSGCALISEQAQEDRIAEYDADGDGFVRAGIGGVVAGDANADCNDADPAVNPDADEICDGIDNNCDGVTDADLSSDAGVELFADSDGDGYGDPSAPTTGCEGAEGYVTNNTDCDDTAGDVNPDATEICNELDDNCDNSVDEGVQINLYRDIDGDGFGDENDDAEKGCAATATLSETNNDCDDSIAEVNPEADEICNGDIDDDCNGLADDADDATINKPRSWPDLDGDGYGDASLSAARDCVVPNNYVETDPEGNAGNTDCDDDAADVNPGATEVCDGIDNNCTDGIDEGLLETLWPDLDGDTFGDKSEDSALLCPGEGLTDNGDDCNDTTAESGVEPENIYPGADEVCNTVDDNCDGLVDNDVVSLAIWYADTDDDNFGLDSDTIEECFKPDGYVSRGGDCNDDIGSINPGAEELCSTAGVDDDCDNEVDEPSATDVTTWFADTDDDGFGDSAKPLDACVQPADYVGSDTDCDDARTETNPSAPETCNSIDDDCDDETDEEPTDGKSYFSDSDGDTFGDPDTLVVTCANLQPDGTVADDTDCDDTNGAINPAADELCSTRGVDDDCDDEIDENDAADVTTWYADTDSDLYGDANDALTQCDQPDGYVEDNGDCLDSNASVNPSEAEVCDKLDTDCSGGVFETLVPDDFATIQAAIDAESDAGLICVDPGTHNGPVDFGTKNLILEGTGGSDVTTIDAQGGGSALRVAGNQTSATEVRGFTLTGGEADYGAGLFVGNVSSDSVEPLFEDLRIRENGYTNEGDSSCGAPGIFLTGTDAILRDIKVYSNTISCIEIDGGAVRIQGGKPTLDRIDIRANSATTVSERGFSGYDDNEFVYGGAILIDSNADVTIRNLIVAANRASARGTSSLVDGCTILVDGADADIESASIHKNICTNPTRPLALGTESGGTVNANIATGAGSKVFLTNVDISDNDLAPDSGDPFVFDNAGALDVAYTNLKSDFLPYTGNAPSLSNIYEDLLPRYENTSAPNSLEWSFVLRTDSALLNKGDPSIQDDDGKLDIGAYGGPGGASW